MKPRDLDDRLVPAAAARLRVAVSRFVFLWSRAHLALTTVRSWNLATLDRKLARRGPLARLARQPAIGAALALAVLAGGLAAAGSIDPAPTAPPVVPTETSEAYPGKGPAVLGPNVGQSTQGYERAAAQSIVQAVQQDPAAPRVALVSLTEYRTPAQAAALLSGFGVSRAYLRAKAAGPQASSLPVEITGSLRPALQLAYADAVTNRLSAATSYRGYVEQLSGTGAQDKAFQQLYSAFERASRIEAKEFGRNCACVFAVLVSAPAAQFLTLSARPGVRSVQLAGPGIPMALIQVQPLLPETVGIVSKPGLGRAR